VKKLLASFVLLGFLVAADAHRFTEPECKAVVTTLYYIALDRDKGESKADQLKEASEQIPRCHKEHAQTCALKDEHDDQMILAMVEFLYSDEGKKITAKEFAEAAYASCVSAAPVGPEHQMGYRY